MLNRFHDYFSSCVTAAVRLYLRPQVDKSAHVYVTTELVMQIMIKRKAIYLSLVT